MVSKLIQRISKSIQFTMDAVNKLEALAKELGMTRLKEGVETGDVSKIARRMVDFALANPEDFKKWHIGGSKKGK